MQLKAQKANKQTFGFWKKKKVFYFFIYIFCTALYNVLLIILKKFK